MRSLTRVALLPLLALLTLSCGADFSVPPPPPGGGLCFQDTDCVPDGCCGEATSSIVASEAPDCSPITCDGSCPVDQLECGCAIPVCIDSQCAVAVTSGPGCPSASPLPLR